MNNKCNLDYKRVLNKGKSFECSKWQQFVTYTNDFTKQDFVISDGALFVCMQTHLSSEDNKPKLVYGDPTNPHKPTGVSSPYWEYVLYGVEEGSTISKQFNKVPVEWTDGYYFNIAPGETFSYNLVESSDYQTALLIIVNENERWKISTKIENICNWAILDASWKCIRIGKHEGICEDVIDIKNGEHFLCINNLKSYSNAQVLKEQFLNITIDEILETLHNTATKKNVEDVKQDISDLRDDVIKELADITHDISNISSAEDIYKANSNGVQTYGKYINHRLNSPLSYKFDVTTKYLAVSVDVGDVVVINTKYKYPNVIGIYDQNNICVRIIESTNPDIYKTTVLIQNNETQLIVNCDVDYNGYITKLNLPKLNEKSIKTINSILENKVDKIPGKTLTSNDYTSDDKAIVSLARNFLQKGLSNTLDLTSSKPITSRAVYNLFSNELFYPGVVNFSIGTTPSVMKSQDYENCFVVVQPGDRFFINAISENSVYTWGLFDTSWNCVRTGNGNINEIIQVQEGELILYVNNLLTNKNKGVIKINAYEQTIDEIRRDLNNKANLDQDGKIATYQLPDYIFGQLLFGGTVTSWTTDTITISPSNKFISKFELPYDTTSYQIYKDSVSLYEGVYFIIPSEENSTIFDHVVNKGDWIVSTGNEWVKIDNSDPSFDEIIETLNAKADSTGNYPEMSVGSAHDLTGRKEATPEEFKYRPSAGEKSIRDENATIKSIKGNSVVWNNKIKNGNFADNQASDALPNGWENGSYYITLRATISYPSTGGINFLFDKGNSTTNNITMNNIGFDGIIKGHKYLLSCDYSVNGVSETSYPNQLLALGGTEGSAVRKYLPNTNGVKTHFETIHQPTDSSNKFAIQMVYGYVEGAELWINNIIYIDLTQMFGSGNEPATVDEFYARIPEGVDINAYNEGELINFTAESIKTTGFNQFNGVVMDGYINDANGEHVATTQYKCTDYISVLSNQEYYINSEQTGGFWGAWYDSDKKFIKGIAFYGSEPLATSPTNAAYIRMTIATPSNLGNPDTYCINLSHSGVRDGEYEPYKEFTHDLSWIKRYFPNGMKSAGSVYDEIQYNESTQQWVAIQRIGEVDLGSLDWDVSNKGEMVVPLDTAKKPAQGLCLKYNFEKTNSGSAENDKSFVLNTNTYNLRILDSDYTDAEFFKEAISGVKLYYELVEPIVTPIEEVVNFSYEVGDFGTEEIISNGPTTPFKGNIVYGFNAVDRIRDNSRNIEKLNEKTSNKVDKENGKGLSSNDYTSEEKEQVERVRNGSVVVDNTLSALDETSNKPVSGKGIAEAIAQATNSINGKLTQLEQKAKASECVNLIYGMPTIDGFYNNLGELKGTDADMFVAVKDAISIVPNNIYVYVGDLYAQIYLVFLGENNEVIDTFGYYGGIEALRENSYISSDGYTHYTFVALIAPKGATKMLVSSLRTNIPLSLYSLGTGVDFQSSIDNIYTELHRLGTPIEKSLLRKGRFWKGAKGETLSYAVNSEAACIQLPIKEGNSIFVKSVGNAAAPPILWVDADNEIIDIPSTSSVNGRYVAPANTEYCCVNLFPFYKDFEAHYISAETTELFNRVSILEETVCPYIGWTLPTKFYSIVGLEKSIYLDNIVLRNDDAPSFVLQINKSFGTATNKYFRYTPTEVGQRTLAIDAWDSNNKKVDTKSINIETISNTISSVKTICCIGDSITEKFNMPYYIESCLDRVLSETSARPIFVGTKGGESGMGGKPTRHEGWYGRTYGWLATNSESPLVNPSNGQTDIAYYRSVLGLENKIDVVSLAMGYNGTANEYQSEQSFASMQKIITAFKADNANTKFIVHLVTYPATGNVLVLDEQERIDKKNSLHYFRQLCLNAYGNGQDGNIMIGDLGLVYDRWYAYPRRIESPTSYYPSDSVEVVTDMTHPSDEGTKQIAEGIAPCILKMMQ